MSRPRFFLHVVLFVSAATQALGCGGDNGNQGASNQEVCDRAGDISVALNCPGLTTKKAVVDQCLQEAAAAPAKCKGQFDSAKQCAMKQPNSSFQCSSANDGTTELKDGFCTNESAALLNCLMGG